MDLNAQIGCSKLWPGSSTSEISDKKSMDSIEIPCSIPHGLMM